MVRRVRPGRKVHRARAVRKACLARWDHAGPPAGRVARAGTAVRAPKGLRASRASADLVEIAATTDRWARAARTDPPDPRDPKAPMVLQAEKACAARMAHLDDAAP